MERFLAIRSKNHRLNLIPSCTKYDPKNEFIWKKAKQFPPWKDPLEQTHSKKPKETIQPKFYKDTCFKIESKNFVDMSRQTDRKSFIDAKNHNAENCFYNENSSYLNSNLNNNNNITGNEFYRMSAKTQGGFANFHSERKSLKSAGVMQRNKKLDLDYKIKDNAQIENVSGIDLQNFNPQINKNNVSNDVNNITNKDSFNKLFYENSPKKFKEENLHNSNKDLNNRNYGENSPKRKNISSMLKHRKTNKSNVSIAGNIYNNNNSNAVMRTSRSANPLINRRWNKIQAPDFKKVISRETRDKMYDDKKRVTPFSIPPYHKTRPSILKDFELNLILKNFSFLNLKF